LGGGIGRVKGPVVSGTTQGSPGEEFVTGDVLGAERYADLGMQSGEDAGDGALMDQDQQRAGGATPAGDEGIDVTTTVQDHGNRLSEPVRYHAAPGDDEWRQDEEAETDTPENTGSKVGTGRDDLQP
jgi:hypothetical protein